jgi:hypothetical protein
MKVTKNQLKNLIGNVELLKEERYDCIKDYMAMGYSRSEAYEECPPDEDDDDYGSSYGGRSRSSYSRGGRFPKKTTHVGVEANAEKIAALEASLEKKSDKFLNSVLSQLKGGRGLSAKQKAIVKKILIKNSPESVALFESIVKEEYDAYSIENIRERGQVSEMAEEVSSIMNSMGPGAFSGKEAYDMIWDAFGSNESEFWYNMLSPGGPIGDAIIGLKNTSDEDYDPDIPGQNEGNTVKITKNQLSSIIKETKAKLIAEYSPGVGSATGDDMSDEVLRQALQLFGPSAIIDEENGELYIDTGLVDDDVEALYNDWINLWPDAMHEEGGLVYTGISLDVENY